MFGVGAAACAACCAGPILAFLGGLTVVGAVSTLVVGTAGLVVALAVGGAYVIARRSRAAACDVDTEPVPIEPPVRR